MTTQKPNETQCNPVTKLMDMYAFKEEVQKVYNTVQNKEYVIIYFDVDNFKLYNSHYSRQKVMNHCNLLPVIYKAHSQIRLSLILGMIILSYLRK